MRKSGIESFRFIAIVAVVVIHVYPSGDLVGGVLNQLARFAVPYFFIISGYFFYRKVTSDVDGSLNYFINYGLKLFYIYVFWYLVYAYWPLLLPTNWSNIAQHGFLYELKHETSLLITEFRSHLLYYVLAGGRAEHLWFLPALGMGIVLLYLGIRLRIFLLAFGFATGLFLLALLLEPYHKSPLAIPLHMSGRNGPFFSSVFVFIGAAIARYDIRMKPVVALLIMLVGASMHLGEVFMLESLYGMPLRTHNYVVGTLLFASGAALYAMARENFGEKLYLHRLGGMTLGIYVSHLLIAQWLYSIDWMPEWGVLRVILVTTLAVLLVALLNRLPVLRKLS